MRYDEQKIVDCYKQKPISISELSKIFNLCSVTASKILKRNNCKIYTKQELNIYNLKTDYFYKIDTEIKSYLLGLFIADGCIFSNNKENSKSFTIQLKNEDSYMIDFIKEELCAPRKNSSRQTRYIKKHYYYQ